MFEILCDNLNQLMQEAHISADELARRTSVPASTIKKIRNRYNPNPTLATLLPLAQFFSVTLDQLIGNEPLNTSLFSGRHQPDLELKCHIPILSWEESVNWPATQDQHHPCVTTEFKYSTNAFALVINAEEWNNLAKGTLLFIDPSLKAEHRDYAIMHKNGQKVPTFKQILYEDGQIYLKSIIPGYNITVMTPEYKFLGLVIEFKKHLKNTTQLTI
jgi:transcriptional regulator with XRE-family HTH domain